MGNEVTIDSLKIQLETDASEASGGLEALEATLTKIKNATKGGVGLTAVATQLGKVNTAISGINSSSVGNLTGLAKAIDSLSKVKVSATIAGQLGEINEILPKLDIGDGATKITELVSALKPLEELGKSSLSTTVNALKKLPEAMEKLDTKKLYGQVQSLTRIMRPLAVEMEKIAQGFSAFPSRIQKLIKENENLSASTNKVAKHNKNASVSFLDLGAKIMTAYLSVKKVAGIISGFVIKSNNYVENVNLFTVAMGTYAEEAGNYADQVADIMGIDPSDWMRSQGVFMTLATGFGVASDRAYTMSKNLTQLGYDLSSFFNISTEDAMQKLQSGISGELEPLRRLGYDLSQAKLEATALALGIDKSVSSMTQAEKAQLRYHAILTQVTSAQGDMARTLDTPANQLRILKAQLEQTGRAIGNIFIPALQAVLPYVNAFFQIIRAVADVIASLFGFELPTIDYSGLENISGGADTATDSIDGTTDAVKKLQKYTMGFDELNIIDPSSGKSDALDSMGSLNFDLPEYDFLGDAQKSKVSEIVDSMKEWLGITDEIDSWSEVMDTRIGSILKTVGLIGTGLAAWKISGALIEGVRALSALGSKSITWSLAIPGLALFLADIDKFKEYFDDFSENGATFTNVAGMISEFAGMIGDACLLFGQVQIAGALKTIQGIGEIVTGIKGISESGVNVDSVLTIIRGLSNIAIGIGAFTGNLQLIGGAMVTQGLTEIINEIASNWEAIKQGDWSGVDKVKLAISAIEVLGGLIMALGVFSKLKNPIKSSAVGKTMTTVTDTVGELTTTTSTLTTKLTSLVKDIGLALVIMAEIAIGAMLFVGAIWVLGIELNAVGAAWQPVIDNGETIGLAMALGTGVLVAVGAALVLLGNYCTGFAPQIALGVLMLAELGVATGLFLVEIWAIGKALDEIGIAWQPVLDNGETIATAIGIGTGLLVGIGVVTAALGVATVATAGLLPLAIGLGTALLVELAIAFIAFCDSLIEVALKLTDLAPPMDELNAILPGLKSDMDSFTSFMGDFAEAVVAFTAASAIAGIAATIDTVISFFTTDPISKMYNEVTDQSAEFEDLIPALEKINPLIDKATELVGEYKTKMGSFESATGGSGGFLNSVVNGAKGVVNGLISLFEGMANGVIKCINTIINGLNKLSFDVPDWVPGYGGETFGFNIKTLSEIKIPRLATGGMVDSGQMFVAREAGPELVGTIGRKTAVVNNEQIIQGIASGVSVANAESNALLREQNSLLRSLLEKETGVYLDGKHISDSVDKYKRERGRVVVTGGAY